MEGFVNGASDISRNIVSVFQLPVVIILLIGMIGIVIIVGSLIGEFFTEHLKFKVFLPALVDDLKSSPDGVREIIKRSGLLLRQKQCLIELTRHPDLTDSMRESMAVGLEYREQRRYDTLIKLTNVMARVGPMLGLLGTLIPLGPGIIALGNGDTQTLSQSLLTAFDSTALGLVIAGIALIVSAIRGQWYKEYMVNFDAALECVLELESNENRRDRAVSGTLGDYSDEGIGRKFELRERPQPNEPAGPLPAPLEGELA